MPEPKEQQGAVQDATKETKTPTSETKPTGPTDNAKQMQAKPELVDPNRPVTGVQGARSSPPEENPQNPQPVSQAEMRGDVPPGEERAQKFQERQQDAQKMDSPEEQSRKSVAQGGVASNNTDETELSASRSRTQNPAGGHTPEQLIHERKSDL